MVVSFGECYKILSISFLNVTVEEILKKTMGGNPLKNRKSGRNNVIKKKNIYKSEKSQRIKPVSLLMRFKLIDLLEKPLNVNERTVEFPHACRSNNNNFSRDLGTLS